MSPSQLSQRVSIHVGIHREEFQGKSLSSSRLVIEERFGSPVTVALVRRAFKKADIDWDHTRGPGRTRKDSAYSPSGLQAELGRLLRELATHQACPQQLQLRRQASLLQQMLEALY